jgi:hypothetical protein
MEPKLARHMEPGLDPELRRGLNRWATCILIALAIFSAQILFALAKIQIATWATSVVYGISLVGFFYSYISAAKFATSVRKKDSGAQEPQGLQ